MSYPLIESAKTIVETSNLSKVESITANEAISSLNSKPNVTIPIFNPLTIDNFSNYGKPNAIVRPVIRKNEISDYYMTASQSNETIIPQSSQVTVFKQDNSGQIDGNKIDSFVRKLDVNNQKRLSKDKGNNNSGLLDQAQVRPRFFTIVPTGIFLKPSKEIKFAQKCCQPRPYAFFSIPKIFAQKINEGNKRNQLTEIRTIEAATTIGTTLKRREPNQQSQNIMYDRRVIRGSNYSHNNIQTRDYDATAKIAEAERRLFLRKRYSNRKKRDIIGTPPPVKGRRHEIIQTEQYLEELLVKPNDYSVECQTDLYLYEVPEPMVVSSKNGVDVATEIDDYELYNFNIEIEAIADVIVAFSMEQAIHEFMLEQEIFEIYGQQQQYLILKNAQSEDMNRFQFDSNKTTNDSIRNGSNNYSMDVNSSAEFLYDNMTKLLPTVLTKVNEEIRTKNIKKIDKNFSVWLANVITCELVQTLETCIEGDRQLE